MLACYLRLRTVAALYVATSGVYYNRVDVDPWDVNRDARLYQDSWPVVAHPPCAAWSRMASLREWRYGYPQRQDGGCFYSALRAVLRCGGVLEHPANSMAWSYYNLQKPRFGSWQHANGYWVTECWQVDYGHRARKRTWLLYCGCLPPFAIRWERRRHTAVVSGSKNHSTRPTCGGQRVWSREAKATPPQFAETLLALARGCK